MDFIKHFSDYSVVTGNNAERFNLNLKETIDGYQKKGFPVDIKFSTCFVDGRYGTVCYSAIVLAYEMVKVN